MNFFKNLFSKKENQPQPDNTKLLQLIAKYNDTKENTDYVAVLDELYNGNCYLVVPTAQNTTAIQKKQWTTLQKGETLEFTTVFNVEGLMVFGVFTSEIALSKWINEATSFVSMPAKAVLEIAEEQNFGRIVIDSDQETMFVLEKDVSNHKQEVVKEDTEVLVWMPKNPISGDHKKQMQVAFAKVSSIEEVYHFGMTRNGESILILAMLMNQESENARLAVMGAINDGMHNQSIEFPLEIMYLKKDDHWMQTAQQFDLFYKR